jgi:hypothetical protein
MKTTVDLPAALLRQVKAAAALGGRTMKELVIEALRAKLKDSRRTAGGWRAVFGRATSAAVRDVDQRIKATERVDVEDWQ